MKIIDDSRREFVAKNIADMGKAILTVGFASYFFERLPAILRIGFVVLGTIFFISRIFIYPRKGGK